MKNRLFILIWISMIQTVLMLLSGAGTGWQEEPRNHKVKDDTVAGYIQIGTVEELAAMRDKPDGKYILTQDIDLDGYEWIPFVFHGILDGNGYALLNMTINQIDIKHTEVTYDGNVKPYDTYLSGMFSVLRDAKICNLQLINQRINIVTEGNCFLGGIAGFAENTVIDNCTLTGQIRLYVSSMMFGIGGVAGYGYGSINHTMTDQTLVIVDTDTSHKNEEFLGGAVGAGYFDIANSEINIKGYVSDHGFVHNGGVMGMYMFYPEWVKHDGYLTDNIVKGFITFFEDNTNRRAYCSAYISEIIHWSFEKSGNQDNFICDERFVYDCDLLPHMCENAKYEVTKVECTEETYGYTIYTCQYCGYKDTDHYTVFTKSPTPTLAPTDLPTPTPIPPFTQIPEPSPAAASDSVFVPTMTPSLSAAQTSSGESRISSSLAEPSISTEPSPQSAAELSFPAVLYFVVGTVVLVGVIVGFILFKRYK